MENEPVQEEIGNAGAARPGLDLPVTRRQTLIWGGASLLGLSALRDAYAHGNERPFLIMGFAKGMIVADPVLCVGCGRCELACTEFNDGRAAPSLSRIKIDRNLNAGPQGFSAWRVGHGNLGDGLIIQDLCLQCPHPVPCANLCPENAIVLSPVTGARWIDPERCTGCKICLRACPWEMISFDPESRKATKCDLCGGNPKCVEACPAGALSYAAWRDLTGEISPRNRDTARLPPQRAETCQSCHLPGQARNVRDTGAAIRRLFGGRRPREEGDVRFQWIDLAGVTLVPLTIGSVLIHALLRRILKK